MTRLVEICAEQQVAFAPGDTVLARRGFFGFGDLCADAVGRTEAQLNRRKMTTLRIATNRARAGRGRVGARHFSNGYLVDQMADGIHYVPIGRVTSLCLH